MVIFLMHMMYSKIFAEDNKVVMAALEATMATMWHKLEEENQRLQQ